MDQKIFNQFQNAQSQIIKEYVASAPNTFLFAEYLAIYETHTNDGGDDIQNIACLAHLQSMIQQIALVWEVALREDDDLRKAQDSHPGHTNGLISPPNEGL